MTLFQNMLLFYNCQVGFWLNNATMAIGEVPHSVQMLPDPSMTSLKATERVFNTSQPIKTTSPNDKIKPKQKGNLKQD
jgi:hypothetical protein